MQHNRIPVLSSSETCHPGSSSNNPDMDPNNATVDDQVLLPNALENESLPRYLLNSHEMGMSSGNLGQQSTSLSLWESAGSSSMGCLADRGNFFQSKGEHFAPPLSIGGPLSINRRDEATSSLPSHSLNIDLNINQNDQFGMEDVDVVHSSGQSRANTIFVNRGSSTAERIPRHEFSFNAIGSSSRTADRFDSVTGQEGGVHNHPPTFKRKNVDGSHAESSGIGSSRIRHQNNNIVLPAPTAHESTVATATNYAVSYTPVEQLNQSTNVATSSSLSDHYSLYNDPLEHEFVRNRRMRMSPNDYDQSLPSLLPEGSFRCSAYQPTPQSSSFIPVQPGQISSSASTHGRPHLPAVTQFSQNLNRASSNGNIGSRIGGSSSSGDTIHISSSHDPERSLMRSDLPEPLLLGSSLYSADSTNFPPAPGSRGDQQNSLFGSSPTARASVNVGTQQALGTNSSQPDTTIRGSADMARRSLISAGVRSSSIALHHRGSSSTSHEIRSHQPGSSSRAPQHHYYRGGPPSADGQNSSYSDLQSFMQTIAASRDGSRTVSELRNVVDQIRQGRNARLEDLLLIDRSLIMRRANLIDRHQDMRLDVDNMSYEELLALGERIGYVNSGLSEEKIMTSLKQRKYVCLELEEPSTVVEPCCICQEEYVEGEDVGRLDCGHDFHTACIKQWLVIKNICPVCKKSALGT